MPDNRNMAWVQLYIDREIENLKNTIWNRILPMCERRQLVEHGGRRFCPACGRFFSDAHAEDKPNFCENCGQAFDWPGGFEE